MGEEVLPALLTFETCGCLYLLRHLAGGLGSEGRLFFGGGRGLLVSYSPLIPRSPKSLRV